ncbi:HEAT repeat domain-containing protein [Amycolatopsis sp. NPDC004747]
MIEYEDVRQWVEFDVAVRRASGYRRGRRLSRRPSREELAEAVCDGDGYLREAAVRQLAVRTGPEVLPLLLLRCVDWVRPVRELARSIVLSKLDDESLRVVLPLLGVLRRRQVDGWMTALLREALPGVLEDALALEDRETRRWVHAEAVGLLSSSRLLGIAVGDPDFVVRSSCGNALLDRGEYVSELLAGGAPKVRMRALTLLGPEAAVAHLADRSSAVRSMAQALVLKAGGDPAAHYRAMPLSFGVLAGLGETGIAADAAVLERHLADGRPRIRRTAVRGLRRIAPESASVRPLLTDPSPSVTRQAVAFLRGRSVDPVALRALLSRGRPVHTRRAAAALLRDQDTWLRLHTNLTLLTDPDLAADAHRDIHAWLHHSASTYTTPSPDLAAEIDAACAALAPALAREIRFALPKPT